jgi:hypothetical protein
MAGCSGCEKLEGTGPAGDCSCSRRRRTWSEVAVVGNLTMGSPHETKIQCQLVMPKWRTEEEHVACRARKQA